MMPFPHVLSNTNHGATVEADVPSKDYRMVEALVRTRGLRYADFWFTDLAGRAWRITMPTESVTESLYLTGLPLDGQPIGGSWDGVMLLVPQADASYPDPGASAPTLAMICDVLDLAAKEPMVLEPRHVLKRAERRVSERLGATIIMGVEPEFMLIDRAGRVASEDLMWDFLRLFAKAMSDAGIQIDWFRTGPAPGQGRLQMRSGPAIQLADLVMLYRRTAGSLAHRQGLTATFLPKPVAGEGALGMPLHQTLWRDGRNLFHDPDGWALTSELCRWYAGGILAHLPALLAFCAPTINSYRRLIPGIAGPIDALLSTTRKTGACRIPARNTAPAARRVKFCASDPTANPYLAFSAVIMAGLDGIQRKLEPAVDGAPLPARPRLPHCLESALEALDEDREFLTADGVFSHRLIDAWIAERWTSHIAPLRSQPHPWELANADLFVQPGGLRVAELTS